MTTAASTASTLSSAPQANMPKASTATNASSPLREALWTFRREFFMVGVFSAIANLLMLTPTIYMLNVYDRVMISGSDLTLVAVSLLCLFLLGVMALAEWTRSRVLVRLGMRLDEMLSTRVFNASFEDYLTSASKAPTRAFNELIQVRQFLTGNGVFALFDSPWGPIYIAVMFLLHPLLGWLAIAFALVQAALAWFGHRKTVAPTTAASQAQTDAQVYLQGKLRNAEVLESMGMVDNLYRRWLQLHQRSLDAATKAHATTSRVNAFSKYVRHAQQSLSLGAGALLAIDGQISIGAMIAANVLMTRALAPIDMLVANWQGFIMARDSFRKLEELLAGTSDDEPALRRVAPKGDLELQAVTAPVAGRAEPILKGISFAVKAGTVVAVLGPSGSGKSTLARCIMGIWPKMGGEVLLDGLPLRGWNRAELGPFLGYMPQDVELFDGTIAENIARFSEVDSEKVIAAARGAGLHEMILRFPKGYDTPIGEAGSALSGGQRQRIALARAIYDEPALIVLDEPNANLDDAGEAALAQTVQQLKAKGKTVVLITHLPGIVGIADHIVLLDGGALKASGPRDAVLAALRAAQQAAQQAAQPPVQPTPGRPE